MRLLARDLREVYLSNGSGRAMEKGSDGRYTGRTVSDMSSRVGLLCSVSTASGGSRVEAYGDSVSYDLDVVCDDPGLDVREGSRLWVDDLDSTEADHTVVRVVRYPNATCMLARRMRSRS